MKKEMKNVIAVLLNASVAVSLGVFLAACGDDSGSNSNTDESGMESCTVTKSADSTSYVLKCPDGTEVEIHDGKNGVAGKNGVSDTSAAAGAGCTVKELEGGSVSLECPDGTKLVFGEDGKIAGKGSSSSATGTSSNSGGDSSSSAKPSGNSSSSQAATGKTQGYVQFNSDTYGSIEEVSGAGIYLFDADNQAKTAMVTVYADSPDSLQLTLDRRDLYFYAPLPMIAYGTDSEKALFVDSVSKLVAKYMDPSTGVAKFDSATVNLTKDTVFTRGSCSISFGRDTYYDLVDKAVITYRDNHLTGSGLVMVHVRSLKVVDQSTYGSAYDILDEGRYIPLYPVAGGEPYERIGFVGFTLGEPGDGEVKVEDGGKIEAICDTIRYQGNVSVIYDDATWKKSEFFGMTCEPGKVLSGEVYPDRLYVCEDGFFRAATDIEADLGKIYVEVCPNDGSLLTGTSGEKYACGDGAIRTPTDIEIDLGKVYFGVCPNDGSLLTGTSGKKYVCGDGTFRAANEREISIGKGCTDGNLNEEYGEYTCMFAGAWGMDAGSFTDPRDNQTYKTVKISTQIWMAENLNYAIENSWCYDNDASNCTKYGRLYTWATAVGKAEDECGYGHDCTTLGTGNVQGVCPAGWHVPTQDEWNALFDVVGGKDVAGKMLKSMNVWPFLQNSEDAFGFSALPAGYRSFSGNYDKEGNDAFFWSSTEINNGEACFMYFYSNTWDAGESDRPKDTGNSVRCLKD